MVDVNRGTAGYHLEAMPDGQQVLVNDRTGNVAITDPYSGQITGEMPRAQAVAQHQPGAAGGSVVTPKTVVPPAPSGPPPPAAGGGSAIAPKTVVPAAPSGPPAAGGMTPRAAAQTSGNVVPRGLPQQPDPNQIPGPPGSDVYDWWTVNRALQASGLNGWQIAGDSHRPVNTAEVKQVKNPAYVSEDVTPDEQPFILQANQNPTYKIGIWNPATDQRMTVTLGQQKNPDGSYAWSLLGTENQAKIDKAQPGYSSPQQMTFADGHVELWGTNTATGAFEKMPNTPEGLGKKTGWNDIKQIDDGQGHKVWVGTDPDGRPMQPVPGTPTITTDRYTPGSVKQVTKNGKLVYVGQNPTTGAWEDIPELGSEVVAPKTTTVGKNVYTVDPNGQLVLATAIAQPKEGDTQWVDAGGGYAKQQTFHNGDWHDDDVEQKPVRPDVVRAAGALKHKGEKYWIPLPGSPDKLVQVTADGNGGYTYEMGPNGEPPPVKQVPGIKEPTEVTGGGTSEFYPQRRDPVTGNLLPPERNPNWQPTNVGDRVRQLQNTATQKQQELHAQVVSGTLSEDEANQQFNDWWKTTIDPAKQEIQLAQQWKVQEQQRLQEEQQRSNLATAQAAGSEAVRAVAGEHRVGPGFGNLMGNLVSAGAAGKFPTAPSAQDMQNAFVTPMPNYNDIYEQATARALAHISPTAAQLATGQPTPSLLPQLQNVDVTAGLNPTNYRFGGAPPPAQQTVAQTTNPVTTQAVAQPIPLIAQPNAVAGQNYGAATAYPSGILPWNYMVGPYQPAF